MTTARLSTERLFDILADDRRRLVLQSVAEAADDATTFEAVVQHVADRERQRGRNLPDDHRADVEISLHHNHLPRLADAGVVEYDARSGTVRYRGNDRLEAHLAREAQPCDVRAETGRSAEASHETGISAAADREAGGRVDESAFGFAPGRIEEAMAAVERHEMPESIAELADEYDRTVGGRDRFLWRWLHHLLPHFTLSCVDPAQADRAREAKFAASMFVTLLDDVAEKHQDGVTLDEASKIPFAHRTVQFDRDGVNGEYLRFAEYVWDRFETAFERGERADEFADVLRFDCKQVLDAMEYSYLISQDVYVANSEEVHTYDPYNMMLFAYVDIDLAFSPSFDRCDLPALRAIVTKAQEMARIGNWITTWEREVTENDFSSGVVVNAIEEGIVTREDLVRLRDGDLDGEYGPLVDAIADRRLEADFAERWKANRRRILRRASGVESVDVESFVEGMETVMLYHLASRGLK